MSRLAALALVALVGWSGEGWAASLDDVEVTAGRVIPSNTATSATFTVRNRTDALIPRLSITCTILDEQGVPKDVRDKTVMNVGAKQTVYDSLLFYHTKEGGTLTCRASEVD